MLTEEFIKSYASNNVFTYQMFKVFFNHILEEVYKLKTKSILLESTDGIDDLLITAKKFKELYFHCNKHEYFNKFKITVHVFLLELEVNSLE